MNHETIEALQQWASQIESTVVNAAPKVWAVALQVKHADAVGALVTGLIYALVMGIAAAFLWTLAVRSFKRGLALDATLQRSERTCGQVPGWMQYLVCAASTFAGVGVSIEAWYQFSSVVFDQWIWIAIANPGLAVAHDIILKVLAP